MQFDLITYEFNRWDGKPFNRDDYDEDEVADEPRFMVDFVATSNNYAENVNGKMILRRPLQRKLFKCMREFIENRQGFFEEIASQTGVNPLSSLSELIESMSTTLKTNVNIKDECELRSILLTGTWESYSEDDNQSMLLLKYNVKNQQQLIDELEKLSKQN